MRITRSFEYDPLQISVRSLSDAVAKAGAFHFTFDTTIFLDVFLSPEQKVEGPRGSYLPQRPSSMAFNHASKQPWESSDQADAFSPQCIGETALQKRGLASALRASTAQVFRDRHLAQVASRRGTLAHDAGCQREEREGNMVLNFCLSNPLSLSPSDLAQSTCPARLSRHLPISVRTTLLQLQSGTLDTQDAFLQAQHQVQALWPRRAVKNGQALGHSGHR